MYELGFENLIEIRVGSSYFSADVILIGEYVPDLHGLVFQNKGCLNSLQTCAVLVQWEIEEEQPGFVVWLIAEDDFTVKRTERFRGCCDSIRYIENDSKIEVISYFNGEFNRIILEI